MSYSKIKQIENLPFTNSEFHTPKKLHRQIFALSLMRHTKNLRKRCRVWVSQTIQNFVIWRWKKLSIRKNNSNWESRNNPDLQRVSIRSGRWSDLITVHVNLEIHVKIYIYMHIKIFLFKVFVLLRCKIKMSHYAPHQKSVELDWFIASHHELRSTDIIKFVIPIHCSLSYHFEKRTSHHVYFHADSNDSSKGHFYYFSTYLPFFYVFLIRFYFSSSHDPKINLTFQDRPVINLHQETAFRGSSWPLDRNLH